MSSRGNQVPLLFPTGVFPVSAYQRREYQGGSPGLLICSFFAGEPGNPIPNKAPFSTAFSASAFCSSVMRDSFLSMARKRRSSGSPVQQSDGPAASARCGRLTNATTIVIKNPEPGDSAHTAPLEEHQAEPPLLHVEVKENVHNFLRAHCKREPKYNFVNKLVEDLHLQESDPTRLKKLNAIMNALLQCRGIQNPSHAANLLKASIKEWDANRTLSFSTGKSIRGAANWGRLYYSARGPPRLVSSYGKRRKGCRLLLRT